MPIEQCLVRTPTVVDLLFSTLGHKHLAVALRLIFIQHLLSLHQVHGSTARMQGNNVDPTRYRSEVTGLRGSLAN